MVAAVRLVLRRAEDRRGLRVKTFHYPSRLMSSFAGNDEQTNELRSLLCLGDLFTGRACTCFLDSTLLDIPRENDCMYFLKQPTYTDSSLSRDQSILTTNVWSVIIVFGTMIDFEDSRQHCTAIESIFATHKYYLKYLDHEKWVSSVVMLAFTQRGSKSEPNEKG